MIIACDRSSGRHNDCWYLFDVGKGSVYHTDTLYVDSGGGTGVPVSCAKLQLLGGVNASLREVVVAHCSEAESAPGLSGR